MVIYTTNIISSLSVHGATIATAITTYLMDVPPIITSTAKSVLPLPTALIDVVKYLLESVTPNPGSLTNSPTVVIPSAGTGARLGEIRPAVAEVPDTTVTDYKILLAVQSAFTDNARVSELITATLPG
jgi:hypothetical protein